MCTTPASAWFNAPVSVQCHLLSGQWSDSFLMCSVAPWRDVGSDCGAPLLSFPPLCRAGGGKQHAEWEVMELPNLRLHSDHIRWCSETQQGGAAVWESHSTTGCYTLWTSPWSVCRKENLRCRYATSMLVLPVLVCHIDRLEITVNNQDETDYWPLLFSLHHLIWSECTFTLLLQSQIFCHLLFIIYVCVCVMTAVLTGDRELKHHQTSPPSTFVLPVRSLSHTTCIMLFCLLSLFYTHLL